MSIMAGRARKQRHVIRLSKARITLCVYRKFALPFRPPVVLLLFFGTLQTGRSPLEMSVHSGEAVISTPHSK